MSDSPLADVFRPAEGSHPGGGTRPPRPTTSPSPGRRWPGSPGGTGRPSPVDRAAGAGPGWGVRTTRAGRDGDPDRTRPGARCAFRLSQAIEKGGEPRGRVGSGTGSGSGSGSGFSPRAHVKAPAVSVSWIMPNDGAARTQFARLPADSGAIPSLPGCEPAAEMRRMGPRGGPECCKILRALADGGRTARRAEAREATQGGGSSGD